MAMKGLCRLVQHLHGQRGNIQLLAPDANEGEYVVDQVALSRVFLFFCILIAGLRSFTLFDEKSTVDGCLRGGAAESIVGYYFFVTRYDGVTPLGL
ncbi:hypothetical protein CLV36_10595 [Laceyella sediminis]|jgi:hypothetical protein|uniref:Uncharacterized protein n=1 Tax=Laceyella sediminis TaxID=573074 RepID=A0ABX5EQ83_9BACL|nr:hypothetical protein [Laceyella sediminis]PRZ14780.1 hypothetical protein CLV36_10595 [Laceyella sediminis]